MTCLCPVCGGSGVIRLKEKVDLDRLDMIDIYPRIREVPCEDCQGSFLIPRAQWPAPLKIERIEPANSRNILEWDLWGPAGELHLVTFDRALKILRVYQEWNDVGHKGTLLWKGKTSGRDLSTEEMLAHLDGVVSIQAPALVL
jgi:hypothetical protein